MLDRPVVSDKKMKKKVGREHVEMVKDNVQKSKIHLNDKNKVRNVILI